jgi:hypothetical protein
MFTDNEEGSPNAARRVQRWELPSAPLSGSDCVLIPKGRKSFRDDLPVVSQSWRWCCRRKRALTSDCRGQR